MVKHGKYGEAWENMGKREKICVNVGMYALVVVQDQLDFDIILTTYNMVISSSEDRVLFKKMQFVYVVFDEAHMLKNMASQRYEQLMKIRYY